MKRMLLALCVLALLGASVAAAAPPRTGTLAAPQGDLRLGGA